MNGRDLALTLLVVIVWGVNFVFAKMGVDHFPPVLMAALRFSVALVPAIFLVKKPDVPWRLLVAYGMTMGVIQFTLIFSAMALGFPGGLTSVVLQVQAFFTIALSVVLLGERLRPISILAAIVSFGGIALIAAGRFEATALLPLLLLVGATISWSFSNIISKRAGDVDKFAFLVWSCLIPPIPLFAISWVFEGPERIFAALANPGWQGITSILYMGFASTLLAYGIWNVLLQRHPASTIAPFSLLVPVVGIAATALFLGERFTVLEAVGAFIVIAGLAINTFGARYRRAHHARAYQAGTGPH